MAFFEGETNQSDYLETKWDFFKFTIIISFFNKYKIIFFALFSTLHLRQTKVRLYNFVELIFVKIN